MIDKKLNNTKHYNTLDGVRSIACLLIILMHIKANTSFHIGGYVYNSIIGNFAWLVMLFFMISAFSMCVGYAERFNNGTIDLEKYFYRRFAKVLPFFAFLILIAIIMEHNIVTFMEGTMELTLLFGFLPNNKPECLGVCWFLGIVFVFYIFFPFFSVLIKNKKRAWLSFIGSLWIIVVCFFHFWTEEFVVAGFEPKRSFLYCLPVFICGGLIYLYRDEISAFVQKLRWFCFIICCLLTIVWFLPVLPHNDITIYFKNLILFSAWLAYSIGCNSKFLSCKIFRFISGISLELYLSHMVIFRLVQKLHLVYLFGDNCFSFLALYIIVLVGLVIFIKCFHLMYKQVSRLFCKR